MNAMIDITQVERLVIALGSRIRQTRIRRKLRQQDLAEAARCSRSTIRAIEAGELTCSIGAVVTVLWVLGVSRELDLVADPAIDESGTLEYSVADRRVRPPRKLNNDF